MLRVGKYDYKQKREPGTVGFMNVLIHTTGELSPYQMKDINGVIMENYWQFSKIWEKVYAIKQPISQWDSKSRWEHDNETHLENGEITEEYWRWREKGMNHTKWVRYPNSYKHHSKTVGSVIGTPYNHQVLNYIDARKKIYYEKYREIAIQTEQFKMLKKMLDNGINIQINEVDGPTYMDEYPYNLVNNGSIEITEETLIGLINNPSQAFGHGYSLAAALLGIDFD